MTSVKRAIFSILLSAFFSIPVFGANEENTDEIIRPVAAAYTLEAGSSHIIDTYLSPLKYSGWTTAFSYDRWQAMKFSPDHWIMNLHLEFGVERTANPAKNAAIWGAGISARWGMLRKLKLDCPLKLAVGGSTGLNAGALYTTRNGNNPVAAKASWTVNITAMASWNTKFLNIPVTIAYRPTLPLTGIFFSQQYGELYYEIYLGDRKGLVHGATPFNYFSLDNLLTADFRFGATNLRLGYHNTILSTHTCNITTRQITHSVVFGVSGEWISLGRKPINNNARFVSAYY